MPETGTVLVVDDEPSVCTAMARLLEREGCTVLVAHDGDAALQLLQEHPVHLIICDQHMPGMSGIDILKLVRVRHPHVVRVMITGDTSAEIPVRSINEGEVYRFIKKPWNNKDVRALLHYAFKHARSEHEKNRLLVVAQQERDAAWPPGLDDIEAELLLLAQDEADD